MWLFISLCSCSGSLSSDDIKRKEFQALESALIDIVNAPEQDWLRRVENVKKLPCTVPKVQETKKLCVLAYEKYGAALVRLTQAKQRVASVESALESENPKAMTLRAKSAAAAIDETNHFLNDAEKLVAQCASARQKLRKELTSE